jgi:predicted Zn-dependent protease
VVLALLLAACATRVAPLGPAGWPFTPEADERRLWAQADREAATLVERVGLYDDPALAGYLASLVERLTPAARTLGGAPAPRVMVLRDPTLAAFALPDGRIVVHAGLVAAVQAEAQLALVLARELGHVKQRHALAAWRAGRVTAAPARGITPLSPTAAAIRGAQLPVVATAAMTGYGDGFEREADAAGLAGVVGGGWDARAAVAVWSVLARDLPERGALERFLFARPAWVAARRRSGPGGPGAVGAATADTDDGFETHRRRLLRDNAADDLRHGRFALARRQLEHVLAAEPTDARAQLGYGDVHRLQAQRAPTPEAREAEIRQARARYARALALDPALAQAHRQLGLLYYQQQSFARARAELQEYLRQAPTAPDAARISEYVRELGR